MSGIITVLVFVQTYVLPILFAIGLIFLIYGVVHSFVLDRSMIGHPWIVRSVVVLLFSTLLAAVVVFLLFLFGGADGQGSGAGGDGRGGDGDGSGRIDGGGVIEERRNILPAPDVPRR